MLDDAAKRRLISKLATRMGVDRSFATDWVEAMLQALEDPSVIGPEIEPGIPVLRPLTPEARERFAGDAIAIDHFPFRVGRESRQVDVRSRPVLRERRKRKAIPSNDLYLRDTSPKGTISREHFQIEKKNDGSFELLDRGSSCGTIVGNRMIGGNDRGGQFPIRDGDTVTIGRPQSPYKFEFRLGSDGRCQDSE
jgi:hypothetical protein